jgi:glycosyltransferase involved in cell wall biosynthesis
MISVIIPVHNGAAFLRRCLEALATSRCSYECIVVNDGSTDETGEIARSFPGQVIDLPDGPRGPAYARNRGAEAAQGDIVFFLDADVIVGGDTLERIEQTFVQHPEVEAVFGSYDDRPAEMNFLSLYKNLAHHFVHQQAAERAVTFWSGCGAVRRKTFFEFGGFDEVRYPRPSIEDIEFGYRLRVAGRRVLLDKRLQVQHLKQWTLRGMLVSDIRDRAMPWTALSLRYRMLPNDLNLRVSQRLCALLLCVAMLYIGLVSFFHNMVLLPLLAAVFILAVGNWSDELPMFRVGRRASGLAYALIVVIALVAFYSGVARIIPFLALLVLAMVGDRWLIRSSRIWRRAIFATVVLSLGVAVLFLLMNFSFRFGLPLLLLVAMVVVINRPFYVFLGRKQGALFALAAIPFHLLYYIYSTAAFGAGLMLYLRDEWLGRRSPPSPPVDGGGPASSPTAAAINPVGIGSPPRG